MRARLEGPPLSQGGPGSLAQALSLAANTDNGIVLVDASEKETFVPMAELLESARRVAGGLVARGISRGDPVALVLPTGRDFLDAFFGVLLAGAVPVPLYPPARLGRMDEYVQSTTRLLLASRARLVLTESRVMLLLGRAIDATRPPLGCCVVKELAASEPGEIVALEDEELALIQFSSGTTVDPKPVALTQANLLAQCAALKMLLSGSGTRHVGVSWLPLYHDMGLIGCLLSAVIFPGTLVLIPPEVFLGRPAIWLRAISRHRATVSPAPNFAYGLCLRRVPDEELAGVHLSSWQHALNGAEPVAATTLDRFVNRFGRFGFDPGALRPVYGLSEASLAVTFTPRGRARICDVDAQVLAKERRVAAGARSIVSVGVPVPGCQVEVRSEDGEAMGEREVGRIYVRGPSVMKGYFGQTSAVLQDGWLDTGDLGFVDGGELFVCGRAKDVIVIRGANHAPQEFEDALEGLEGVRTGCTVAVGFEPEGEGEELLVLAESTTQSTEDLSERIAARILERTGIRPYAVVLLTPGTLPRTSSGKLRRGEALRRFLAGSLTAPDKVTPLLVTREIARSMLGHARSRVP